MNEHINEKAILVGIAASTRDVSEVEKSLDELARLLDTAGGEEFARLIQVKDSFDVRTCIGTGKVQELSELAEKNEIKLVVFDFDLSPSQIRNLEEALGGDVEVIDRSMLILDIFALHAVTGEGKLQVELAQLNYTAPRLIGRGRALSRLGGGIGTRGPGESKLEQDKRHLHERINTLERQLAELEHNRRVMRASRDRSGLAKVAIVGYTNAGKSTLLNALTDAGVLCRDMLFATLDPTTRRLELPDGTNVLLTDTVGFIRKLPHHLVHAFRSTLDEVTYADVIVLVSDACDPEMEQQIEVTHALLEELGAADKPVLYVYNKCDKMPDFPKNGIRKGENKVYISAAEKIGLALFLEVLTEIIGKGRTRHTLKFSYTEQGRLNTLHEDAVIENIDYQEDGVYVTAVLDGKARGRYRDYMISSEEA